MKQRNVCCADQWYWLLCRGLRSKFGTARSIGTSRLEAARRLVAARGIAQGAVAARFCAQRTCACAK